jgi:hypothetical protein
VITVTVDGHAINNKTVWFKVSRTTDRRWMVSRRNISQLHMHRPPGWWGGEFDTKQEAIDYGSSQGWVLVENWDGAREHALTIRKTQREKTYRGTTLRNIRISEDLWIQAQIKAQQQSRTVSDVVREFLTVWTGSDGKPQENHE